MRRLPTHPVEEKVGFLEQILKEKNDIIKSKDSIIKDKDQIISDLKLLQSEKSARGGGSGIGQSYNPQHAQPLHQQSSGIDPAKNPAQYLSYLLSGSSAALDSRDSLIRELIVLLASQVECKSLLSNVTHPLLLTAFTPVMGTYKFEDGEYAGELVLNIPNGRGVTKLANGDRYEGEYLHGKKSGVGVYRWSNGDIYEGDHLDGVEHGKGVYKYAEGDVYTGDYKKGRRNGFGVLRLKSGTTEYGYFRDGHYSGKCIMIAPDETGISIGEIQLEKQEGVWKSYLLQKIDNYRDGDLASSSHY